MLIKFTSEQTAGFVMLEDAADQLLTAMGHGGSTEGAVSGEALTRALESLNSAIARAQEEPADDALQDTDDDDDEDEEGDEPEAVALPARAAPLMEMLRRAKAAGGYVMWRPN